MGIKQHTSNFRHKASRPLSLSYGCFRLKHVSMVGVTLLLVMLCARRVVVFRAPVLPWVPAVDTQATAAAASDPNMMPTMDYVPAVETQATAAAASDPNMMPTMDYAYDFIRYHEDYKAKFPLPPWIEEFLARQPTGDPKKHHDMLTNPSNKFLVMTCYKYENGPLEACGGFTDRLFMLVYNIWIAYKTDRKLLIKYYKPRPLEEFLVPPPPADHGFNWMLPDGYFADEWHEWGNRSSSQYQEDRRRNYNTQNLLGTYSKQRVIFLNNNLAIRSLKLPASWNFTSADIYEGIFRRFFQPSLETARRISLISQLREPGTYAAAHIRVRWPARGTGADNLKFINEKWWKVDKSTRGAIDMQDNDTAAVIAHLADHAVECAVRVMPSTEYVYVASDAHEAIDYLKLDSPLWSDEHSEDSPPRSWTAVAANHTVLGDVQNDHGWGVPSWEIPTRAKILMRHDYREPAVHFDAARFSQPESSLYATFVDLWVLAHAGAHSIGNGGFGRFGAVLAGNQLSKRSRHRAYSERHSPSCATSMERKAWKKLHP